MAVRTRQLSLCSVIALVASQVAVAELIVAPLSKQLEARGVSPGDRQSVAEAARSSEDGWTRVLAVRHLTQSGDDVSPYLVDPSFRVRMAAAEGVGPEHRDDALEVLAEDYRFFTRSGIDRNKDSFHQNLERAVVEGSIGNALDVAIVLAKLGDHRGIDLAELALIEAPFAAQRYRAIEVLKEIAVSSRKRNEDVEPAMRALRRGAEKEREILVLRLFVAYMSQLGGDEAADVVAIIQQNEPDSRVKQRLQATIDTIRAGQANTGPRREIPKARATTQASSRLLVAGKLEFSLNRFVVLKRKDFVTHRVVSVKATDGTRFQVTGAQSSVESLGVKVVSRNDGYTLEIEGDLGSTKVGRYILEIRTDAPGAEVVDLPLFVVREGATPPSVSE